MNKLYEQAEQYLYEKGWEFADMGIFVPDLTATYGVVMGRPVDKPESIYLALYREFEYNAEWQIELHDLASAKKAIDQYIELAPKYELLHKPDFTPMWEALAKHYGYLPDDE